MWNNTGNVLLHKDDVGKSKPTCYKLPPDDVAYGNHNRAPEKHVKDLMNDWQYGDTGKKKDEKAKKTKGGKKKVGSIQKKVGTLLLDLKLPEESFPYGIPNRPSTPIKNVINNYYGNTAEEEALSMYESRLGLNSKEAPVKSKLRMTTTKATLMSKEITDMKINRRKEDPIEKDKNLFKLKKFKQTQRKVSTNRKAFEHHTDKQEQQETVPQEAQMFESQEVA